MQMWNRLKNAGRNLRLFFQSIRFRLTLWSVAVLAVILLAFSLFVYSRQMYDLQNEVQAELEYKTQQMLVIYRVLGVFVPGGEDPSSQVLIERQKEVLHSGDTLALIDSNGQLLQKIGQIDQDTIQQIIHSWQNANQDNRPSAGITVGLLPANEKPSVRYQFYVSPLYIERHAVGLIIIGQPLDPMKQMTRLALTLVFGSLATLALVLSGGYWLAGRAMAPVRMITRTARAIGETDLNRRLRLGKQDELGELADTFDAMLDRLQAAFDRQRQFTADASHELRTPLTIVGLETERALERRRTGEEYERTLRVIQSENQFMAHLVNDLLTLARMDAGQATLKFEPLDISDVTLEVVERLVPLAQRDGVELINGDLPEVCVSGDRQFLLQMLTNLVENAIKYAGGAGKHVWVETGYVENETKPLGWVRVTDDGPGIPSEHQGHLFDRFYRVDQSRTRAAEMDPEKVPSGSGLGLSIVQWIAHAHGGEVSVQSEFGKGASFEVRLPRS